MFVLYNKYVVLMISVMEISGQVVASRNKGFVDANNINSEAI